MSEFTDGLLIRKPHAFFAQVALTDLMHPYIYKVLNDHWIVIVFEDSNPQHEPVHSWILRHSQEFPMLYFYHGSDDGWGYRLFHAGKQSAGFEVDYNISYYMAYELADQIYPGVGYDGGLSSETLQALYQKVESSEEYKKLVTAQYTNPGVEGFSVFGFPEETIIHLHNILRSELYRVPLYEPTQVDLFLKELDLEEMSWVSYHYLKLDQEEGHG